MNYGPWLALTGWSLVILLAAFGIGYRCGRLGERERCRDVVISEPELPGEMPDEAWALSQKINLERSLRIAVVGTKENIRRRIEGA